MKYRNKYLKAKIQLELKRFFKERGIRFLLAANDNAPDKLSAVFEHFTTTPVANLEVLHACMVMKLMGNRKGNYPIISELHALLGAWTPRLNTVEAKHLSLRAVPAPHLKGQIIVAQWLITDPDRLLDNVAA